MGLIRRYRTPLLASYRSDLGAWGRPGSTVIVSHTRITGPPAYEFSAFKSDGSAKWTYDDSGGTPTYFGTGLAIGADGSIYVGISNFGRVQKLTPARVVVWTFVVNGGVSDIAVDADDNVHITASRSNTWTGATGFANYWKLDSNGNVVATFDSGGSSLTGVEATIDGGAFVCGPRSSTWPGAAGVLKDLWKINSSGSVVWAYLAMGGAASGAQKVTTDSDGYCYIAANYGTAWQGFGASPGSVAKIDGTTGAGVWLSNTNLGINLGSADLVVADGVLLSCGDRPSATESVWRHNLTSGAVAGIVDLGSNTSSIAVGQDGAIYATATRNNSWAGSGGAFANLWRISRTTTPTVVWSVDVTGTAITTRQLAAR